MLETNEYRLPQDALIPSPMPVSEVKTVEYFPGNNISQSVEYGKSAAVTKRDAADKATASKILNPADNVLKDASAIAFTRKMERLRRIADEVVEDMPQELFDQLHGGIALTERFKLHPRSDKRRPLYVLGEYCNSTRLGRHIILYGGSILRIYGSLDDEKLKKELVRIIKHEFTHHIESLCGERDLEIDDEMRLERYRYELD